MTKLPKIKDANQSYEKKCKLISYIGMGKREAETAFASDNMGWPATRLRCAQLSRADEPEALPPEIFPGCKAKCQHF